MTVDGEEAWTALQRSDAPSVAILDWMMPGLDGVEICRRLRRQGSPTPPYVILLTSNTRQADVVAGLEAGADDYSRNPASPWNTSAAASAMPPRIAWRSRPRVTRCVTVTSAPRSRRRASDSWNSRARSSAMAA